MANKVQLICFIVGTFVLMSLVDGRSFKLAIKRIRKDACPKGSYYNQETRRCQILPCGGTAIFTDTTKRCSKNYLGIKVHPLYNQFYYICEKKCVTFVKCPENQVFNATLNHCAAPPPPLVPDMIDAGSETGKPCGTGGSSNCSLFYICDANGTKSVKKIPGENECFGHELNPDDYFEDYDLETFPLCKRPGRFRSPTDCSLYYTCSAKTYGKYYQTRYRCPAGTLYDIEKERCRHKDRVKCEYVTIEDIIDEYDKHHNKTDVDSDDSDYEDSSEMNLMMNISTTTEFPTSTSRNEITSTETPIITTVVPDTSVSTTPAELITSTTGEASTAIKDVDEDYDSTSTTSEATTTTDEVTSSEAPTTEPTTTQAPITESSSTEAPITDTVTTQAPTTTPEDIITPSTGESEVTSTTLISSTEAVTESSTVGGPTPDVGNIGLDNTTTTAEPISTTESAIDITESTMKTSCNGSSLHLEDDSVETLKVHVSKPLKLLINFAPKLSCKECSKDEAGHEEEHRFKKVGKIAIVKFRK